MRCEDCGNMYPSRIGDGPWLCTGCRVSRAREEGRKAGIEEERGAAYRWIRHDAGLGLAPTAAKDLADRFLGDRLRALASSGETTTAGTGQPCAVCVAAVARANASRPDPWCTRGFNGVCACEACAPPSAEGEAHAAAGGTPVSTYDGRTWLSTGSGAAPASGEAHAAHLVHDFREVAPGRWVCPCGEVSAGPLTGIAAAPASGEAHAPEAPETCDACGADEPDPHKTDCPKTIGPYIGGRCSGCGWANNLWVRVRCRNCRAPLPDTKVPPAASPPSPKDADEGGEVTLTTDDEPDPTYRLTFLGGAARRVWELCDPSAFVSNSEWGRACAALDAALAPYRARRVPPTEPGDASPERKE
jgi:hypothetical protein